MRRTRLDAIGFLLIAGIVICQSMLPPVVSQANNGDFGEVLGHFSLGSPFNLEWAYAPVKFHFDPAFTYHAEFRSSETLLVVGVVENRGR